MPRSRRSKKKAKVDGDGVSKHPSLSGTRQSSEDSLERVVLNDRPRRVELSRSRDAFPTPIDDDEERPTSVRPTSRETVPVEVHRPSISLTSLQTPRRHSDTLTFTYRPERRRSRLYERHRNFLRGLCPLRYIIVVMASAGLAIVCGLRTSVHVTFLVMINHSAVEEGPVPKDGVCENEYIPRKDGPYAWDATTRRVLVTSYNFGRLSSQIPGGFMALKSSSKWTIYIAMLLELALTAVFPLVMDTDWTVVSFILLLQGFCGGIIFPCMVMLIANWAFPNERSTFCGIVFAGQPLGHLFALLSFYVYHASGSPLWQFIFWYILLCTLPWFVVWPLWCNSSPVSSEWVSQGERLSILIAQRGSRSYGKLNFPFKKIRASPAFWVLTTAHFGVACISYMIEYEIPAHFREVLLVPYEQVPVWFLPHIGMIVICVMSGIVIDYVGKRNLYDMTLTRKIGATIAGMMIPAVCLLGLAVVLVCKVPTVMIILAIAVASLGAYPTTILVNHVDLSPNFAGALMGATGTLANIPQFVIPVIMGSVFLNESNNPYHKWSSAFATVSILSIVTCILFVVWGRGEVQPWNGGKRDSPSSVGDMAALNPSRSAGSRTSVDPYSLHSRPSGQLFDTENKPSAAKMNGTQERSEMSDNIGFFRKSGPGGSQKTVRTAGAVGTAGTDTVGAALKSDTAGTQGTSAVGAVGNPRISDTTGAATTSGTAGMVSTPNAAPRRQPSGTSTAIPHPTKRTTFGVEPQGTSRISGVAGASDTTARESNVPGTMGTSSTPGETESRAPVSTGSIELPKTSDFTG